MSEYIYLGTAPGQAGVIKIGGAKYVRNDIYPDVPGDHLRRGGFMPWPMDFEPPEPKTDNSDCVVVLGSAPGWREELDAVVDYLPIIAVNGVGTLVEEDIAYWVSIHGRGLVKWMPIRAERGFNTDYIAYGNFQNKDEDGGAIRWNRPNSGGSSGLHAVELALELGFDHVILCGMPLEGQQRVRSLDGEVTEGVCHYSSYHDAWEKALPKLDGCVKSMSGWTAKLLGKPSKGWLK